MANSAATTVATGISQAASTGASTDPQVAVSVPAGEASSVGVAQTPTKQTTAEPAVVVAQANDPQVSILGNNFAPVAAIPVAASAENPNIHIAVGAGLTVIGVAYPPNQSTNEPGQLITLRDQGHTVTVKER